MFETAERGVHDGGDRPVVPDGWNAADGVAGRFSHLVAVGLAHVHAELARVHPPVPRAQAEERAGIVDEDQRLDDLADLDADRGCCLLRGPGRVHELLYLGVEAEFAEALLESLSGWVHRCRTLG